MSRGINKVILIGNLGNDPDIRYSAAGKAVANISLATSETWKDKDTGEQQEKTEWHRCVAFGRTAEIIGEYLKKGSQVYIEGKLQTRKWTDKEGVERYTTEIVINEMQMLGAKSASATPRETVTAAGADKPDTSGGDPFSDDIPFMRITDEYCR